MGLSFKKAELSGQIFLLFSRLGIVPNGYSRTRTGSLFILFHLNRELTSTQLDCDGRVLGTAILDRPFFMPPVSVCIDSYPAFLTAFTVYKKIQPIWTCGLRIPVN